MALPHMVTDAFTTSRPESTLSLTVVDAHSDYPAKQITDGFFDSETGRSRSLFVIVMQMHSNGTYDIDIRGATS